jgi:hypothetical protein
MRKKIYLAGPYTRPDPCVNTRTAILAADELWELGFAPFVPHLSHYWHGVSPHSYVFWLTYDLEWVPVCDALLRLPGESSGADLEEACARENGVPVFHDLGALVARFAEGTTSLDRAIAEQQQTGA